jgi:hypothetical protein
VDDPRRPIATPASLGLTALAIQGATRPGLGGCVGGPESACRGKGMGGRVKVRIKSSVVGTASDSQAIELTDDP